MNMDIGPQLVEEGSEDDEMEESDEEDDEEEDVEDEEEEEEEEEEEDHENRPTEDGAQKVERIQYDGNDYRIPWLKKTVAEFLNIHDPELVEECFILHSAEDKLIPFLSTDMSQTPSYENTKSRSVFFMKVQVEEEPVEAFEVEEIEEEDKSTVFEESSISMGKKKKKKGKGKGSKKKRKVKGGKSKGAKSSKSKSDSSEKKDKKKKEKKKKEDSSKSKSSSAKSKKDKKKKKKGGGGGGSSRSKSSSKKKGRKGKKSKKKAPDESTQETETATAECDSEDTDLDVESLPEDTRRYYVDFAIHSLPPTHGTKYPKVMYLIRMSRIPVPLMRSMEEADLLMPKHLMYGAIPGYHIQPIQTLVTKVFKPLVFGSELTPPNNRLSETHIGIVSLSETQKTQLKNELKVAMEEFLHVLNKSVVLNE